MQAFLCAFPGILLAIPMESVASIIDFNDAEANQLTIMQHSKDPVSYVSVPGILDLGRDQPRHGIVLKDIRSEAKVVLLSTKIVCAEDIPDGEIQPVPRCLRGAKFSALIRGLSFAKIEGWEDREMILVLDVMALRARAVGVAR